MKTDTDMELAQRDIERLSDEVQKLQERVGELQVLVKNLASAKITFRGFISIPTH